MHALDYFCSRSKLQIKDLASMLGVKQPQINSWKKGDRNIPKHHLETLCEIFMVPFEKSRIFEIYSVDEKDRAEIELILNENILKNALEHSEEFMPEVIRKFEDDVKLSRSQVEILRCIHDFKVTLQNSTLKDIIFDDDIFQAKLDAVKNFAMFLDDVSSLEIQTLNEILTSIFENRKFVVDLTEDSKNQLMKIISDNLKSEAK